MIRTSAIVLLIMCFGACQPDVPAAVQRPSVNGRWVVTTATRGGRPTSTLDAAYFEFDTVRTTLKTNFTGQEEMLAYTSDDSGIATPAGELFQRIDIASLSDSILDLSAEIQGTRFTFRLRPDLQGADDGLTPVSGDTAIIPRDDDPEEEM